MKTIMNTSKSENQHGIYMGKIVYCPKCKRKYENPVISRMDNEKPIVFCYCGCYFAVDK